MTPTIDLSQSQIMTVIGGYLTAILPAGVQVVQGQDNLVGEPMTGDFVVMWPTGRARLAYNNDTWVFEADPTTIQREVSTGLTTQVDVHGPNSADNAQRIVSLWQDDYGADFFDAAGLPMRPLYADDPQQIPFINAASNYEARWVIKAVLQANVTVSTSEQFASIVAIGIVNVETLSE